MELERARAEAASTEELWLRAVARTTPEHYPVFGGSFNIEYWSAEPLRGPEGSSQEDLPGPARRGPRREDRGLGLRRKAPRALRPARPPRAHGPLARPGSRPEGPGRVLLPCALQAPRSQGRRAQNEAVKGALERLRRLPRRSARQLRRENERRRRPPGRARGGSLHSPSRRSARSASASAATSRRSSRVSSRRPSSSASPASSCSPRSRPST